MKHLLSTTALLLAIWLSYNYLHQAKAATVPFNHSVCQYPARTSNPANSCDNSDPACVAVIKGGECE